MEAINGWLKEELFIDLKFNDSDDIPAAIEKYIHFFNYERPAYMLNYETPISFKEKNLIQDKYRKRIEAEEKQQALSELYLLLNLLCINQEN